jgi:hypothetical protein
VIKVVDYVTCRIIKNYVVASVTLISLGVIGFGIEAFLHQPINLIQTTFCFLYFYSVGRLCSGKRHVFEKILQRIERNDFMLSCAMLCSLAWLLLTAYIYSHAPQEKMNPIFEPQSGILFTGTLGIFMCLILARRCEASRIAGLFEQVGVYSMVIYVQHPMWGSGIRGVLMKAKMINSVILITAVFLAGLVLPVAWQKICDRWRLTKYFGIRPIVSQRFQK